MIRNNSSFSFFPVILSRAESSQSTVLKSDLQTSTWLRLISHWLFITAITSPHIFALLLLLFLHRCCCCWQALLPLFLHLTDLTSLPPSRLPSFFDLQPPVQPILRSFPRTFPQFIHYFLPPSFYFFCLRPRMRSPYSHLFFH